MVDKQNNDEWIELAETRAWNWQQGCMLQWLPGSQNEIIWNDRDGDRFVYKPPVIQRLAEKIHIEVGPTEATVHAPWNLSGKLRKKLKGSS